ncbi:MAG: hypothetical protein ABR563_08315, partial [Pyrinomonadaceae bacterium]
MPLVLGCTNSTPTINIGDAPQGTLSSGDCTSPLDGSFYDAYQFTGTAGQKIAITLSSSQFDGYLYLMVPGETTLHGLSSANPTIQDDDGANNGDDSRIPAVAVTSTHPQGFAGFITLNTTGTYTILANSFRPGEIGNYTLSLTSGGTCDLGATTPLATGSPGTIGNLSSSDCTLLDGSSYDVLTFSGTAGQQVSLTMTASFDT